MATATGTSGKVTLTNGILTTTATKLLSVTNTATNAVVAVKDELTHRLSQFYTAYRSAKASQAVERLSYHPWPQ